MENSEKKIPIRPDPDEVTDDNTLKGVRKGLALLKKRKKKEQKSHD
jgi:hypothetical protein